MYQLNVPIESIDHEVESDTIQVMHFETKAQILEAISQFLDQNVVIEIKILPRN